MKADIKQFFWGVQQTLQWIGPALRKPNNRASDRDCLTPDNVALHLYNQQPEATNQQVVQPHWWKV